MVTLRSDALVVFGVTGDLAHKMIFPALYAMVKLGVLKVPVIGVALPKWSRERLHKRVTDSIERAGGIDNPAALRHLLSLLSYVSGDYASPDTFTALKKELGVARHPAHYLAIPPSLFETVIKGLGAAKLAAHARVIVEKPFGRDLASARELMLRVEMRHRHPFERRVEIGLDAAHHVPCQPLQINTVAELGGDDQLP